MEADFWHKKWEDKEIGFHQSDYNPDLLEFFTHTNASKRSNVLVPLCGKTKDMMWLYEQGYKVYGIELSPIAVMEFFQENNLLYNIKMHEHHQCFKTSDEKLNLYCGDIFDFQKECPVPSIKTVFDRAALVALPPELRIEYVKTLEMIAPDADHLIIAFEYDQTKLEGPPFSVTEAEIHNLFKNKKINLLKEQEMENTSPKFLEAGIKAVTKKTYLINP